MIRIMVVDDERPALRQAERVLRTFSDVDIGGLFTDPDEFLQAIRTEPVDLVLLDMEMPGTHGLALARTVQSLHSNIQIVFVTAYEEYAVEAFNVAALDYVLKPMAEDRIGKTLQRARKRKERLAAAHNDGEKERFEMSITCFGRLSVMTRQGKVRFINSKSEELLAYLLHYNGKPVSKGQLMEVLWPDRDPDKVQATLYSTVYQLRKDLATCGLRDCIAQSKGSGGTYQLALSLEESDIYKFERAYRMCVDGRFDRRLAEQAIDIYQDGYLKEHDYGWAMQRQKDMEVRFETLLEMVVNDHVRNKRYRQAVPLMHKWADILPYNEEVHARIIALYMLLNQTEQAKAYFARISEEIYSGELGLAFELDFGRILDNPSAIFHEVNK